MAYVLATTGQIVQWYAFNTADPRTPTPYALHEVLDTRLIPKFSDKASAKSAAQHLGLKTWRYVKI